MFVNTLRRQLTFFSAALGILSATMCFPNYGNAAPASPSTPIRVVAAENFYGSLIRQIGGEQVDVESILSNADQDPHSFEASPKVARAIAKADLVVANGAAYDPWITSLLRASPRPSRSVLIVADLQHRAVGDNPHLWYDPTTMPTLAKSITAFLSKRDPDNAALYEQRLTNVLQSLQLIDAKVSAMRSRYRGAKVSATEPVFGYMAAALGLDMRNESFQLAVMNESEPSPGDIAAFEKDLTSKNIRALIYNAQTSDQLSRRLLSIAHANHVPVVPVTETEPAGQSYTQWMLSQLATLDAALANDAVKAKAAP